jgi:glutamine amidotransferase
MTRILILDYGVGNLFSLSAAIEKEGATAMVGQEIPSDLAFDGLVFPGVGAFSPVARKLDPMRDQINRVVESGRPVLGVCLGMQVLFDRSEEGAGEGLGLMRGRVVKLPPSVKTPQIGWNNVTLAQRHPLLDGVPDHSWVYYVHSFYPQPDDAQVVVARTRYGADFPAIVARGRVFGTQFHPEKSGEAGRAILRNFLRLCQS